MVYRQEQPETRHNAWPLRLTPERTAAVVEHSRIRCTHFDAYRFFTQPARPLNQLSPTRESQARLEQPGCLHANMDLYKWAFKLSPLVSSELVADCFALARDIRVLDMRASPYDLAELGYEPIPVETPEGRAEYATQPASLRRPSRPATRRPHSRLRRARRLTSGLVPTRYRAAMPDDGLLPHPRARPRPTLRSTGTAAWWVLVAPAALWAVVRVFGLDGASLLVPFIAFTPYVALASLVPLAVTLAARRWWPAALAGVACLALAACVIPRTVGSPTTMDGVTIRVMSANLRVGGADATALVGLVREHRVDVLAIQELTTAGPRTHSPGPGSPTSCRNAGVASGRRRRRLRHLLPAPAHQRHGHDQPGWLPPGRRHGCAPRRRGRPSRVGPPRPAGEPRLPPGVGRRPSAAAARHCGRPACAFSSATSTPPSITSSCAAFSPPATATPPRSSARA